MTGSKLIFHAILINSFLIAAIICMPPKQNIELSPRCKRLDNCLQAIQRYNSFGTDLTDAQVHEIHTALDCVQNSLKAIIDHGDLSNYFSDELINAMIEQSATDDWLDTDTLASIARALTNTQNN